MFLSTHFTIPSDIYVYHIASMLIVLSFFRTKEFTDRVSQLQDELSQIENDIEENQGEK